MVQRLTSDLPGQGDLFPEVRLDRNAQGSCAGAAGAAQVDCTGPILALPRKPTCTPVEAARATGISERQIRYWVTDGTLLAVNSSRCPVGGQSACGRKSKLDRWRIVVRRVPGYEGEKMRAFLTLEELVRKASNMESK